MIDQRSLENTLRERKKKNEKLFKGAEETTENLRDRGMGQIKPKTD